MLMALKGHFLTQMPHPLHNFSLITILFSSKRIASTRLRTMGQNFMQSWLHFLGLHLSWLSTAMRVMIVRDYEGIWLVINYDLLGGRIKAGNELENTIK